MSEKSKKTNIICTIIISFVFIAISGWAMASANETTPFSFSMYIVLIVGIICASVLYIFHIRDYKPDEEKTDTTNNIVYKNPFQKNDKKKEIAFLTSVSLVEKRKGTVIGVVGTFLTAMLWLMYLFTGSVTVIQTAMLNGYTLTAAAALVSIFGICFRDASCMLLAAIALVGALLVDWSTFLGLIPSVLLMISHVQMKNSIELKTKTDTIGIKQD